MLKILKSEMRMPALAAAACAAVILVASPVSAATATDASAAASAYRAYLQSVVCKFDTRTRKAKGNAAKCVADKMLEARREARAAKQACTGNQNQCKQAAYDYWASLPN